MSVKPKYEELVQRVRKLEKEATGRQQAEKIIQKLGAIPMDIMYFEDVEVGNKRTKSVTYQVEKEEIIEFARHWDPRSFHTDETAAISSI